MNFVFSDQTDAKLTLKLVSAIKTPDKWGDVLDHIIETTEAEAAIITLRDKATCQIVNDVALEQQYHSPLIRGFSMEAIVHYLTNLRTIDPWAAFQKNHYPYRPVQMSKVCPTESIRNTKFFDWLKGEGFHDTVVFELDRMAGYWTAINLFLPDRHSHAGDTVLTFAQNNYDLLRNAWSASQELARARQANSALFSHLENAGAPVCLTGANGELLECNDLFRKVIKTDGIRLSGGGKKLSFGSGTSVHGLDRWEQHNFLTHNTDAAPLLVLATPVDPDPRFADKREQMWLFTCSQASIVATDPSPASGVNLSSLTRQERLLYEAVASGKSIKDAGEAINVKRTRAFEIWNSIKGKLSITNAHQLRG